MRPLHFPLSLSGSRSLLVAAAAALALVVSACGEDGAEGDGEAGGDGPTVEITAPDDGAEVESPFTLEFSSSEGLGPTDTGAHHVHVWFDGDESAYEVVESSSFEVSGLDPGEHEVTASLRFADHSEAGAEDTITVMVAGGPGTGGDEEDDGIDY